MICRQRAECETDDKPLVLVLSVYPSHPALHGGQIRLRNIVKAYEKAGFCVRVRGVLAGGYVVGDPREAFLPMPDVGHLPFSFLAPFILDYLIALAVEEDHLFAKLAALVSDSHPDIVDLEHPYLWPFVRRMLDEGRFRSCRIVYGSHNVEYRLKYEALAHHTTKQVATELADAIEGLERDLARSADLVLATSDADAETIASWTKRPVVLAKNGVEAWTSDEASQAYALRLCGTKRFTLFASSAHMPNVDGFLDLCGPAFGFIRPTERIVIAGSAGSLIVNDERYQAYRELNQSRATVLGPVPQPIFNALRDLAHVFLLPIKYGSGTNLKTAEALWAGTHVVGTPHSFRGFEKFMSATNVRIASTPADFEEAVREYMERPRPALTDREREERRELLWDETLKPMIAAVSELL